MRSLLSAAALMLSLFAASAWATNPIGEVVDAGDGMAQRMLEMALKTEVAATDPRIVPVRKQLLGVAKASGETEMAVAAACVRAARYLFDADHLPATSVDVLEGLAKQRGPRALSDLVGAYVAARRNSSGKTHAEALAALK